MDQNDYYTFMNDESYNDKILNLLFTESFKDNNTYQDFIEFNSMENNDNSMSTTAEKEKNKLMQNHIRILHNIVYKHIQDNKNTNNSQLISDLKKEINNYSIKMNQLE